MTGRLPTRIAFAGLTAVALLAVRPCIVVAQTALASADEALYRQLRFRNIGPATMGGRIDNIAVVERDARVIFVATASGGLWKTTNAGTTWEPILDDAGSGSIGDVAVAPSDPNVVWAGTGEPNQRQSSSWGDGVYRSLDGGKTWQRMGLADTHHIGRIAIHPRNPNIVYIAALGHLWGPNAERGIFRTSDGGKTWTKVLFANNDTGAVDVAMDAESPGILYAALYQRRRTPFGFNGGGPHGGLFKSIDGGDTWKRLTNGLPSGDVGRIAIAVSRRDPRIVYATFENVAGGLFRSDDRGETWTRVNRTIPRPSYFSKLRVDPNNSERVWILGPSLTYSNDGGRTYCASDCASWNEQIHADFHAMWINPGDSDHMIAGTDGGIYVTHDGGRTWDYLNSLPLGQLYEVCYDMKKPYNVYGGLQDNGSWAGPSRSLYTTGITNSDWVKIAGGDGYYVQVDPTDANIVYVESQAGRALRLNEANGERRAIRPEPPKGQPGYRFDWNTPILISPHRASTIYIAANRLFRSDDRGDSWTASEDLTTQPDRDGWPIMGVRIGKDTLSRHDGQESYGQITTISESPVQQGVLWVGTDDGNVQVSRDGGKSWRNMREYIHEVPQNTYVSRVVGSRLSAGAAYVTFDGHRGNDVTPYIFRTEDFGQSWVSVRANLGAGQTLRVVREHPRNPDLLFAGGEFGLYVSLDRGKRWFRWKNNLPITPVSDLQIHPRENDLIVGTHGRSVFILDNLAPLEQFTDAVASSDLYVFQPPVATAYRIFSREVTLFQYYGQHENIGHRTFVAPNPLNGAFLDYFVKTGIEDGKARITVLDQAGAVVRELDGPAQAGVNRVVWDLRYPPVYPLTERAGYFAPPEGPFVLPGVYTIRVTVGGREATASVRVEEDPRVKASETELRAHREAWHRVAGLLAVADAARRRTRELKSGSQVWVERLKTASPSQQQMIEAVTSLKARLNDIDARLVAEPSSASPGSATPPLPGTLRPLVDRIGQLLFAIAGYTGPATPAQTKLMQELNTELEELVNRINRVIEVDVPELNKRMRDLNVPHFEPGNSIGRPAKAGA